MILKRRPAYVERYGQSADFLQLTIFAIPMIQYLPKSRPTKALLVGSTPQPSAARTRTGVSATLVAGSD